MKSAFIQTFGCQMNDHDSRRMVHLLEEAGYQVGGEMDQASLVLLNTCSVRENPENKVYSMVGRLARIKKERPEMIIAVGGCVAQQEGEKILKRHKAVDLVFGPDQIFHLPRMIQEVQAGKRGVYTGWQERDRKLQNFIPDEELEAGTVEGGQGMVAITKGCDNHCSFCIVPKTRGTLVSRELDNILAECRDLIDKGAVEILLLGQNVNSYQAQGHGFIDLLQAVADLPGLKRLRFTSPHPNDWNAELTDLMARHPVICKSLHLPFQAGSDRILELMRRDHNQAQYLAKVAYLREQVAGLQLSTDVIVGYPGETEAEFEETLEVLKQAKFFLIYAFKYSPRPGTKAAQLEDDIPTEVKEARLERVLKLQAGIQDQILDAHLGTRQEVLIDAAHPKERGVMQGRTDANLRVALSAPDLEIGDLVPVTITGRREHSLLGDIT
ncbi:MAG: tRNA (N6-isopentenyl adenosine(37)-C2)-methylthiotransferase MiaB [bacterium]|nr:tRNA (N6-isopentenyl adenosine(37)-C2)-methylthiotransferase MiaB [bacterium]